MPKHFQCTPENPNQSIGDRANFFAHLLEESFRRAVFEKLLRLASPYRDQGNVVPFHVAANTTTKRRLRKSRHLAINSGR